MGQESHVIAPSVPMTWQVALLLNMSLLSSLEETIIHIFSYFRWKVQYGRFYSLCYHESNVSEVTVWSCHPSDQSPSVIPVALGLSDKLAQHSSSRTWWPGPCPRPWPHLRPFTPPVIPTFWSSLDLATRSSLGRPLHLLVHLASKRPSCPSPS